MSLIVTIGLGCYGLVALLALRPLSGHYAWSLAAHDDRVRHDGWQRDRARYPHITPSTPPASCPPDGGSWSLGILAAVATTVIWPVALLMMSTRSVKVGAEKAASLRAAKARIAELEKEAGIV